MLTWYRSNALSPLPSHPLAPDELLAEAGRATLYGGDSADCTDYPSLDSLCA